MIEARDLLRERGNRHRATAGSAPCRLRRGDPLHRAAPAGLRDRAEPRRADHRAAPRELRGALADRLVPITHYNGTPIAAENIVRPILGWEKNPSGPGWPTGNVERDNPERPTTSSDVSPE